MVQSLTLNEESIIEETVKTVGMEMALVHSYSISTCSPSLFILGQ